jgi:hypothetical protein
MSSESSRSIEPSKAGAYPGSAQPADYQLDLFCLGNSPGKSAEPAVCPNGRAHPGASGEAAAQLTALEAFLETLLRASELLAQSEALSRRIERVQRALARTRASPGRPDKGQGDLFGYSEDERFRLLVEFEKEAALLTADIAEILLPLDVQARDRAVRHLTRQPTAYASEIRRLDVARPEVMSWSIYSAFSNDAATQAAIDRLVRARIRTLEHLVSLTEAKAHALAAPDSRSEASYKSDGPNSPFPIDKNIHISVGCHGYPFGSRVSLLSPHAASVHTCFVAVSVS